MSRLPEREKPHDGMCFPWLYQVAISQFTAFKHKILLFIVLFFNIVPFIFSTDEFKTLGNEMKAWVLQEYISNPGWQIENSNKNVPRSHFLGKYLSINYT